MTLTVRQYQVLVLISRGLTYAQIGVELGIGRETVKDHVMGVRERLGARTRHEAVAFAYQRDMLP